MSISELDFPTVTVCPPKGSNTALNYDLIKADNNSLTHQDRETLIEAAYNIFIEPYHQHIIRTMLGMVSPGNVDQVYKGFQSFPRPYGGSGFEVVMWNNSGIMQNVGFGDELDSVINTKEHLQHMVIQFPSNMDEIVGLGTLVINLEYETKKVEGWQEEVKYSEGPTYKVYTESKTWEDAEATCQSDGGHLASVHSEREQLQLTAQYGKLSFWIGGRRPAWSWAWSWSDGSPWGYTRLNLDNRHSGLCLQTQS